MENPTPSADPDRPDEAPSPVDVADSGSTGAEGEAHGQEMAEDGTEGAPGYADWRPDPYGRAELRRFFLGRATSVVRTGDRESYDPVPDEAAPPEPSVPAPSVPPEPMVEDGAAFVEPPTPIPPTPPAPPAPTSAVPPPAVPDEATGTPLPPPPPSPPGRPAPGPPGGALPAPAEPADEESSGLLGGLFGRRRRQQG